MTRTVFLRRGLLAATTAASLGVPMELGEAVPELQSVTAVASTATAGDRLRRVRWEHRYRVSGSVWVVFWISRDDVGAARMTRRRDDTAEAISFLGGSDPRRAPNGLNQWGYAVEDASSSDVMVFVVRSIAPTDARVPEADMAEGVEPGLFGASCAEISPDANHASITGVRVPSTVTFRTFDRLVEALNGSSRWRVAEGPRPADAFPGFFTAMMDSIDESVARANAGTLKPSVTRRSYIFKDRLYDLTTRRVERVTPDLLRGKYTYRNRATGEDGDFSITFGATGDMAGVPVEMVFQPSWWARVRLRLDDGVDVPEDPSNDPATYHDITKLCSRALANGATTQ